MDVSMGASMDVSAPPSHRLPPYDRTGGAPAAGPVRTGRPLRAAGRRLVTLLRDDRRGLPVRAVMVVLVAVLVARLHSAYAPGILCPWRRLTGVPCPMCGSTSAFVELGHGHVARAWVTQPFTMTLTTALVVAPSSVALACRRVLARPRLLLGCVGLLAAASWLYQMVRLLL